MTSNQQKRQAGFTFIELMFVVLLTGILSTIAISVYQDFSSKTQIQGAYRELSTLKIPLELKLLTGEILIDAASLGWITGSSRLIQSDPIVSIDINTGISFVEATLNGNVQPIAKSTKIKLIREAQNGWSCKVTKSSSNAWKDKFAPKQCQVIQ